MDNIELLAPAGDLEKLKFAIYYGADAVYFGGEMFSLRAAAGNFSIDDIKEGIEFLHINNKKGYMTINIYPHNDDIKNLEAYINSIKDIPIDAFIVSDPGVISLLKDIIPNAEIHLSTQANTTNYLSANFWVMQGVKRIVTAREMNLDEIKILRENLPIDIEIESFIHGAMCMSYSGRCLLSNFLTGRDANKGACTHPCRWKYALVEEQRPGEFFPIEEDARGSYILNSRDLCMIENIPDLIDAGITSFKIEGRNKSLYYVSTIVHAYRNAIDEYLKNPKDYVFNKKYLNEIQKASHRGFTKGFYYNKPNPDDQNYITSDYTRNYTFLGIVNDFDDKTGLSIVQQRNKFSVGDKIEIFGPDIDFYEDEVLEIINSEGESVESAPHPKEILKVRFNNEPKENYLIRIKRGDN